MTIEPKVLRDAAEVMGKEIDNTEHRGDGVWIVIGRWEKEELPYAVLFDPPENPAQIVECLERFHLEVEWSVGGVCTVRRVDVHGRVIGEGSANTLGEAVVRAVAAMKK